MINNEIFEALKVKYLELAKDALKEPNMPVKTFNGEALFLFDIAIEDKEILATAGIDIALIEDIPNRVEGLRYAQSLWTKVISLKSEKEKQWSTLSTKGFELRDEIMHYSKYAYRDKQDLMKIIRRIDEGASNADMIQDLSDLAVLGRDYTALLESVGFDITKLDQAEKMASEGGLLLGDINGDRRNINNPTKEMRDRAFTYLKDSVDTIRKAGKFVFWKNPKRAEQYTSDYFRELKEDREESVK